MVLFCAGAALACVRKFLIYEGNLSFFNLFFKFCSSQRGHAIKLLTIKQCGNMDSVIQLLNQSFELNKECEIVSSSCSLIKPFKSATVSFRLKDCS